MPSFSSGRAGSIGGWNIESRRTDSLNGIRFDSNRSDPTSSNDVILYRGAGSSLRFWNGTSATTLGAAGASVNFTLNDAYDDGRSITVDAGAVILAGVNEDTAVLNITADGDSSGAAILIANSGSGNDVTGTAGWSVTAAGLATFATNSVVSGIFQLGTGSAAGELTSNGAYNIVISTNSGTNSSEIEIINAANGDVDITLNGTGAVNINGTTTHNDALVIAAGDVQVTLGGLALTDDQNAESVTIINNTATTIGAAATAGVVQIESTSLTTGNLLNLQLTEGTLNGGNYIGCWDATAGAEVFGVAENGALTITGAIGTDVLTLAAGDISVANGSIAVTGTGLQSLTSPGVDIESTNAGAVGAVLRLSHQGGTQAASDVPGQIVFLGEDVSAADNIYAQIQAVVVASTDGSEAGRIDFLAGDPTAGGTAQAFRIVMDGTNAIASAGDGAATGILSSLGNFDIQIQTGNSTTGNITITDGANGAITLTPNGTGAVDIAGKLLHSETTASTGAGAVAITGTVHEITTTGTGDAMTLANGTEGQILHICYVAEGAGADTAILTPTSFNDATITFTDIGESVTLLYTAASWYVVGNGGCTIA